MQLPCCEHPGALAEPRPPSLQSSWLLPPGARPLVCPCSPVVPLLGLCGVSSSPAMFRSHAKRSRLRQQGPTTGLGARWWCCRASLTSAAQGGGGGRLLPTPDPTELVTGSWGWDRKEASAAPRTRGKFADNGVVPLKSPKKPAEKVLVKTKPLTSPRGHRGPLGTGRQPRQGSPLSRVRGPGRGASGGQPEEHATVSLLGTTDDGRNC